MTVDLKKKYFSLWIIGPSASGKTTISKNSIPAYSYFISLNSSEISEVIPSIESP